MHEAASLPAALAVALALFATACGGVPASGPDASGSSGAVGPVSMGRGPAVPLPGALGAPAVPAAGAGAAVPPAAAAPRAASPGALLDLRNWYLTLPTGKKGDPDVVEQPDLTAYTGDSFHLDDLADGIVFTATAGGVTTKGSDYPRSELREMNGAEKASWSNAAGTHTLSVRQAVMQLPSVKPDVVTAQIHDEKSDVIEIRLEGPKLIAQYDDGRTEVVIDPAYRLGTPYDLQIVAENGHVRVLYNGVEKVDAPLKGKGWYFKTGSYVQSNLERGDAAGAAGQVTLYALSVQHVP